MIWWQLPSAGYSAESGETAVDLLDRAVDVGQRDLGVVSAAPAVKPTPLVSDNSTGERLGAKRRVQRLAKRTGRTRCAWQRPVVQFGAQEVAQPMHQCQ